MRNTAAALDPPLWRTATGWALAVGVAFLVVSLTSMLDAHTGDGPLALLSGAADDVYPYEVAASLVLLGGGWFVFGLRSDPPQHLTVALSSVLLGAGALFVCEVVRETVTLLALVEISSVAWPVVLWIRVVAQDLRTAMGPMLLLGLAAVLLLSWRRDRRRIHAGGGTVEARLTVLERRRTFTIPTIAVGALLVIAWPAILWSAAELSWQEQMLALFPRAGQTRRMMGAWWLWEPRTVLAGNLVLLAIAVGVFVALRRRSTRWARRGLLAAALLALVMVSVEWSEELGDAFLDGLPANKGGVIVGVAIVVRWVLPPCLVAALVIVAWRGLRSEAPERLS